MKHKDEIFLDGKTWAKSENSPLTLNNTNLIKFY